MDPPPPSFTGRRRSSVFATTGSTPSASSASPAPRKASTWDSIPDPSSIGAPTASDSSSRRSTITSDDSSSTASRYSDAGSVAGRKASAWDDDPVVIGGARGSVSDVAGRRATAVDRPPWDVFSGAPPSYEGSTWGWVSEITAMSSGLTSDRNRVFYAGNINYIFEIQEHSLAIGDIESIMYTYGVEKSQTKEILTKLDPKKSGMFNTNSQNKQILLDSRVNFSSTKELLSNLRDASKCFEKNLLSPLHFAGYIFEVLIRGNYLESKPRFMILGIYSIFGIMEGSTNRKLTTKDVETFTKMWKLLDPNEAQNLLDYVNEGCDGSLSTWTLYNYLYRRDVFGKQRIQGFDTRGKQNPSLFFLILDKDGDGYLSLSDLTNFAAIFGKSLTNEKIGRVIRKFDKDGDGMISLKDFVSTMEPIFDGLTWEFWLVAILLTFEL